MQTQRVTPLMWPFRWLSEVVTDVMMWCELQALRNRIHTSFWESEMRIQIPELQNPFLAVEAHRGHWVSHRLYFPTSLMEMIACPDSCGNRASGRGSGPPANLPHHTRDPKFLLPPAVSKLHSSQEQKLRGQPPPSALLAKSQKRSNSPQLFC